MESYFENLAAAATSDKFVLETLVKSNAKLTATNAELAHKIMGLTSKNEELQRTMNSLNQKLGKPSTTPSGEPPRVTELCPNCNKVVYHKPDGCFHLNKNDNNCMYRFRLV